MAEARVRVALRVRPFLPREGGEQVAFVRDNSITLRVLTTQLKDKPKAEEKVFTFDHCFSAVRAHGDDAASARAKSDPRRSERRRPSAAGASQEEVYETIGVLLLDNALNGFNGCLFAYGQTGSGKTYTVMGPEKDPGIIPRLTQGLFATGAERLRVSCSFLEIYNEQLKDLLDPDLKRRRPLYVHQHPQLGVYVPHLTEGPVCSHTECMGLLDFGNKIRATNQTNMNSTSSRSHALFILRIAQQCGEAGAQKIRSSSLNLIDLAGSERVKKSGAAGQRLREGQNINSSLSVLGQVISKLAENAPRKAAHVPFRQSKLTYLLTDALSGNSQTLMVAAISPAKSEADETLTTLRFASSVKKVKTVAVRNEQDIGQSDMFLQTMRSEIDEMRTAASRADPKSPKARRLRLDAEAYEHMLQGEMLRRSNDATIWGNARAELDRRRIAALRDLSLPFDIGSIADGQSGLSANSPYLLNISDDISLTGKLLYFLPEEHGAACTVGSGEGNQIRLMGLMIADQLCELTRESATSVQIRHTSDGGRLLVNGTAVRPGEKRGLNHGDRILFGRAFAFRLVVPGATMATVDERGETAELGDVLRETRTWMTPSPGTVTLDKRLPRGLSDQEREDFMQRIAELRNDVDEANELVKELVPADEAYTQDIGFLSSMEEYGASDASAPQPVVQQWRGRGEGNTGGTLLAVWPLGEFYRRLENLRDLYQQQCDQRRSDIPIGDDGVPVAWGGESPTALGNAGSAPASGDDDSDGVYGMDEPHRPTTVPSWNSRNAGPPVTPVSPSPVPIVEDMGKA